MDKRTRKVSTIPTLAAFLVLGLGLVSGVVTINKIKTLSPKANVKNAPDQIRITNINDHSFVVSWISKSPSKCFIILGENPEQLNLKFLDQQEDLNLGKDLTHYFWIQNLNPATKYYFKVNSSGEVFDDNDKPYEVTTAPEINLPLPENDTAYGIILEAGGKPASGAIVYLSMANTTSLSSLVKEDGSWMIPLSMARSSSLNNYSAYDKQLQIEEVFVQGAESGTATALNTTKNDNPFPTLVLGQKYDFSKDLSGQKGSENLIVFQNQTPPIIALEPTNTEISPAPVITQVPTGSLLPTTTSSPLLLLSSGTPTPVLQLSTTPPPKASATIGISPTTTLTAGKNSPPSSSPDTKIKFEIINPSENEDLNNFRPEFQGTAPSDLVLEIKVESEQNYFGQTIVNEKGDWTWTPPANLEPGNHKVTVSYKDEKGAIYQLTRNFVVLAAGESNLPSFTSTPSATLTVTKTPSIIPTKTVTTPTATPTPYVTGSLTSTALFLIMGLALLILGFYQFNSI